MTIQPDPPQCSDDPPPPTFDYIIVGAGASAMGLLYGLLSPFSSSQPPFTVAVVERGEGPPHAAATVSPGDWCEASHCPSKSVQILQTYLGNRVLEVPCGQGLGGSTNIHACLCTPPSKEDFASWPQPWRESLMTSVHFVQDAMHRNQAIDHHSSSEVFYDAVKDKGKFSFPILVPTDGYLWRETIFPSAIDGVPTSTSRTEQGELIRKNMYDALLEPLLSKHPHLNECVTWFRGSEVQRLLFSNDNTGHGVEYASKSGLCVIFARHEVILCAGAIESPTVLLTSGIGHHRDLARMGIPSRNPGSVAAVGRGLADHVLLPRVLLTPSRPLLAPPSPSGVCGLLQFRVHESRFQVMMNDGGVYSQIVPRFVGSLLHRRFVGSSTFFCLRFAVEIVNAIFFFASVAFRLLLRLLLNFMPLRFILDHCSASMNLALLNPKSRGSVAIRIKDGHRISEPVRRRNVQAVVDVGYLSHPDDVASLWRGWNMLTKKVIPSMFPKCLEVLPGVLFHGARRVDSECPAWFRVYCRQLCVPYFHYCGTCGMIGNDSVEWVVDASLRVRDCSGVRVCDASVFPTPVSGPIATTCVALGYTLATMLLVADIKKKKS